MKFRDYFTKTFETRDDHEYSSLKSHYYRSRYDDVVKVVKELIEDEKATIRDENNTYKEILFENSSYTCTVKITDTTPIEMAIDFKITTFNLIGMGKGKKLIEAFYTYLDKKLSFKGIGLYKG